MLSNLYLKEKEIIVKKYYMKTFKDIEKEFDEKFDHSQACIYGNILETEEDCICKLGKIKSFIQEKIKEMLEELRLSPEEAHLLISRAMILSLTSQMADELNSKIDKLIKDE